jgi:PAS domain S-box-containing protein
MHKDDSGREIRKRAEAIAQQSSVPGVSADDKLVYELKVHQIELEMQNNELRESQEELQRSRRLYELLFDWAPLPYFAFNAQGGIIEANQAGVSLLQTERKHLDQKPFVVFLSEEHHAAFFDHIRRVLEGASRQSAEVQIKTRGGAPFWVRLESRRQDTGKGITSCLTAVIDVSDRKRIEDDLILAWEDAVSADRAKSAFLANMSHEIRTPMNGILSMSEVALGGQGLSDELERYLRTIHSSAASLISILDDVLDLSRIETDRRTIEKEPFRPAELIHTVEAMFGPNMTEKQLSLHVDVIGPLSDILVGDRNRLRQILVNLLSNAITYSNAGEITLRVTESEVSGFVRELTFEVHDTGPGIDPAEQQRIRELFKQNSNDAEQR